MALRISRYVAAAPIAALLAGDPDAAELGDARDVEDERQVAAERQAARAAAPTIQSVPPARSTVSSPFARRARESVRARVRERRGPLEGVEGELSQAHATALSFAARADRLDDALVAGAAAEVAGDAPRGCPSRRAAGSPRGAPRPPRGSPGVQMPHCAPPSFTNASCRGDRPPASPSPSTVVTVAPVALADERRGTRSRARRRGGRCTSRTRPRRSPPSCP